MSTAAAVCAAHPQAAAAYRCDGCGRLLCEPCITRSHALLLCAHCGERALPLLAEQPATARELRRHEAITRPYSLKQAFFYPFRGMGLYLFVATLVSMAFVEFLLRFGFGCWKVVLALGLWSLLIGLQFKIVRSTAEGDDELPDWPDYADLWERVPDVAAYLVIVALQAGPAALWLVLGRDRLLSLEPSVPFWAGVALLAWIGAAMALMAWGAAAVFSRSDVLRLDLHVRGFLAAGADAVTIANLLFGLGALLFVLRVLFAGVPFVGAAVGGVLGAYWTFTSAHLAGVLFRRHTRRLEALYG